MSCSVDKWALAGGQELFHEFGESCEFSELREICELCEIVGSMSSAIAAWGQAVQLVAGW